MGTTFFVSVPHCSIFEAAVGLFRDSMLAIQTLWSLIGFVLVPHARPQEYLHALVEAEPSALGSQLECPV